MKLTAGKEEEVVERGKGGDNLSSRIYILQLKGHCRRADYRQALSAPVPQVHAGSHSRCED